MRDKKLDKDTMLKLLSEQPDMVVAVAYLYAINYVRYGCDVTNEWLTAVSNHVNLEKAYEHGYHDAMERVKEADRGQ